MSKTLTASSFTDADVFDTVHLHAPQHRLPVELVLALAMVESGGNAYAWNPEPHYRYLWDARAGKPYRLSSAEAHKKAPPGDFRPPRGLASDRDAEWWGQQASWGPLQVMGAVAREYGYTRHFPRLCTDAGTVYGCMHLARLVKRFRARHGWAGVIAAYNAGSPRYTNNAPMVADGLRCNFVNQSYVNKVGKWVDLEALS